MYITENNLYWIFLAQIYNFIAKVYQFIYPTVMYIYYCLTPAPGFQKLQ